ncbi:MULTISPECIES: hypothetical protein [Halococcus]|uniref:Cell surface glycoprotein n=1 Tax=Halococcus salifodinae DSM 8989 TaxID=1227456 RepID=M0MWX2_9EURY|nr:MULTISPECIES: hypothetical protein [Halococcus]EMA49823.1 hypothetical protein C450_16160 [Halococcus salifodinae DSM 8989]
MRRRTYLAAVSVGMLGFSGCSNLAGDGASAENDGTPTDIVETLEPTETAAETGTVSGTDVSGAGTTTGATVGTNAVNHSDGGTTANTAIAGGNGSVGGRDIVPLHGSDDPVTVTSGEGPQNELFGLTAGPVTAAFSHEGESNFIVRLVPTESDLAGSVTLVNTIGEVEGSQVTGVDAAGPYTLDVTAADDWELTLNQPTDSDSEPLPIDVDGEGLDYAGPYAFDGPTTFVGSHDGDGPFVVSPIAADDRPITTSIFNELGSFEGESTSTLSGLAYLNVRATGEWTLSTAE